MKIQMIKLKKKVRKELALALINYLSQPDNKIVSWELNNQIVGKPICYGEGRNWKEYETTGIQTINIQIYKKPKKGELIDHRKSGHSELK